MGDEIEYPFKDVETGVISEDSYYAFRSCFDPENDPNPISKRARSRGYDLFKYDSHKLDEADLSEKDICELALFMLGYGHVFSTPRPTEEDVVALLTSKGVSADTFVDNTLTFEYDSIGKETAQIIAMVAHVLREGKDTEGVLDDVFYDFRRFRDRYAKVKPRLESLNKCSEPPYNLEDILVFENKPALVKYDSSGWLYVLDNTGRLFEFDDGVKTAEWQLPTVGYEKYELERLGRGYIEEGGMRLSMAIEDRIVYLVCRSDISKYDLDKLNDRRGIRGPDSLLDVSDALSTPPKNVDLHDVIIKDGNVLVSMVNEGLFSVVRYVKGMHGSGKIELVYQEPQHKPQIKFAGTDYIRRLGLYMGNLYFPSGNGLAMYAGGSPKGMLDQYEMKHFTGISPVSKFSFGDDFMVSETVLENIPLRMLCLFTPVHETDEEGLVHSQMLPQPTHFQLEHCDYFPRMTGETHSSSSVSAHGNKFAVTNSTFNRVFIYKVNSFDTIRVSKK